MSQWACSDHCNFVSSVGIEFTRSFVNSVFLTQNVRLDPLRRRTPRAPHIRHIRHFRAASRTTVDRSRLRGVDRRTFTFMSGTCRPMDLSWNIDALERADTLVRTMNDV